MAKILLIDDDPDVLEIFQAALAPFQHELTAVSDGSAAAEKIKETGFDLVVTDLAMPKLPGQALVQVMRASTLNAQTPVLVVSGLLDNRIISDLKAVGRIHFLSKPFRASAFLEKIESIFTSQSKGAPPQSDEVVRRFTSSIQHVFRTMMGVELEASPPEAKNPSEKCGDISSIVSLVGTTIKGSVSISFNEADFLKTVSKLMMMDFPSIDDENRDAVAELLNIIFGHARKALNEGGHDIGTAIPAIIVGPAHVLEHQSVYLPSSVVRLKSPELSLRLEICISGQGP